MNIITKSFLDDLKVLLQDIEIVSSISYTIHKQLHTIIDHHLASTMGRKVLAELLKSHLRDTIYQVYHCRQKSFDNAILNENNSYYQNFVNTRDFIESLSKANVGHGSWEPGWTIQKFEKNGQIRVLKNGVTLWVFPQQFVAVNGSNEIGKQGYIYMVKEFRYLLPGFYMAIGNAPINDEPITTRIYWNVDSFGAISLMNFITTKLNKINIPFKFKVLNNPNSYFRSDAGVLYMNKQYLNSSMDSLSSLYQNTKQYLKPSTPLFAKSLAPGVSLAEDPHNGESFGQHRSKILAESIYNIYTDNISNIQEKMAKVSSHFIIKGLDINHPYLNPGSNDKDYDINLES